MMHSSTLNFSYKLMIWVQILLDNGIFLTVHGLSQQRDFQYQSPSSSLIIMTQSMLTGAQISFFGIKRRMTLKLFWFTAFSTQVLPNMFKRWHWANLMTWSNLFPNTWTKAYTTYYSHVFPSFFLFSISYALRWAIQDCWSSGWNC